MNIKEVIDRIRELNEIITGTDCQNCQSHRICCCLDCGPNLAYFWFGNIDAIKNVRSYTSSNKTRKALNTFEQLKKQYKFDSSSGFWTSNGCKLKWKDRSATCLGYICTDIQKKKEYTDYYKELGNLVENLIELRKDGLS